MRTPQRMYSYDQLKDLLESQMREAAREEPGSAQAKQASERYERFVAHGLIPENYSDEVGALMIW